MAKVKKTKVDDLLGPSKRKAPVKAAAKKSNKVDDLLGPAKKAPRTGRRKYEALVVKAPVPGGIIEAREKKGQNLGRTCLNPDCKDILKHKKGRPRIICSKKECFRYYRNIYRKEYDKVRVAG